MSFDNRSPAVAAVAVKTPDALNSASALSQRRYAVALTAAAMFLAWSAYYGMCLFPGLGGEINPGDSAKFQILGHTSIMVHGPGYPFVLLLASVVRALPLPGPPWWTLAFALSAVPGAIANTISLLMVRRLTGSIVAGVAAATLLGGASLMAVQATEAEVYALTLAFILGVSYLLVLFTQTKRLVYFLAACAVYAVSFGNHLMMIMLMPVFIWLTAAHYRIVLRPFPVAMVAGFIALGASQYLYLAYIAHSPETAYSEYMPLPPSPKQLIEYILGTYFSDLYGSGLSSSRTLQALIDTFRSAHPSLSLPLIAAGGVLFLAGWKRGDASWRGIAILYSAALCFMPFTLWYGAHDIQAFHLPVLGPLLIAAVAVLGWRLKANPVLLNAAMALLIAVSVMRAGQTAVLLKDREPIFPDVKEAVEEMAAASPVEDPIFAMGYGLRMAALYYEVRGELPTATYRLHWRAISEIRDQPSVGGIVVPTDGFRFVRWIEHRRPDLRCSTEKIELPKSVRWPAYAFECGEAPRER